MTHEQQDVLIIGSGLAGLTAALYLADAGRKVTVLNRAFDARESNTRYAQGGIIWWGDDDSPELLGHDIDQAGDEVGSEEAIRILATEGGSLVEELLIKRLGVAFDRDSRGIHRTSEAAHSRARIIHVTDQTGAAIQKALMGEVSRQPNIRLMTGATAIELISSTHHSRKRGSIYGPTKILGAYVLDRCTGAVRPLLASRTIVASGGVGALYKYTTNPPGARGDGIAAAERAGAHVINMEYVQFHPTAFRGADAEAFLISESVRGEGGVLLNQSGERFMARYRPDVMELAPRDEVARAIWSEMRCERSSHVWLDCGPIAAKGVALDKRFPGIFAKCMSLGVDMRSQPIPVGPAAHYLCGGIRADGWGRTNLANLCAVGEVSCTGLHGANRLGSTSLEEGLVWGRRAGQDIASGFAPEDLAGWRIPDWDESRVTCECPAEAVAAKTERLREILWDSAGIIRTEEGLSAGWEALSLMAIEVEQVYRKAKLSDELVGLRNMVRCGLLIVEHARRNRESRGCHFRGDTVS